MYIDFIVSKILTWTIRKIKVLQDLFITVILGIYFTKLQAYEYSEASFTIAESIDSFFSKYICVKPQIRTQCICCDIC